MKTKLIVGLGNPEGYRHFNRHNIGYLMVDAYVNWYHAKPAVFRGRKAIGLNCLSEPNYTALFLKPQDTMNYSGVSVGLTCGDLRIAPEDVLVIHDDLSFGLGTIKVKAQGSSGGHRGVQSVIDVLGPNFSRYKIGIGKPEECSVLDWVLSDFSIKQRSYFCELTYLSIQVIDSFLRDGIQKTMNLYNGQR